MITLKESHPFDSKYRCILEFKGVISECNITYSNLSNNLKSRDLILVRGNSIIGQEIMKSDNNVKKLYEKILNDTPSINSLFHEDYKTKVDKMKSIVNRIEENTFENKFYAIHRFGYVPVIIPEFQNIKFDSNYKIGVYPQEKQEDSIVRKRMVYPAGIKNDYDFLKSLTINTFNLFKKYLEDIGEYFFLIEHSNDINNVFKYCKIIEEIKGESIDSKLDKIFDKNLNSNLAVKELRENLSNHPAVFMAMFGRQLSMLMVNEIYAYIGLSDNICKYQNRIFLLEKEFQKNKGRKDWDKLSPGIDLLFELVYNYHKYPTKKNLDMGIRLIEVFENKDSWGRRFGEFLLFLSIIKRECEPYKPTVPKVFVSHHHNVDSSERLLAEITNHGNQARYNSVVVLKLNEKREDFSDLSNEYHEQFKRVSRSLIWLSDQVLVVLSKKESGKNYKWLVREVEHSLLDWDKKNFNDLIYLKEKGADEQEFFEDIKNLNYDFLSLEFRKRNNERLQLVYDHFAEGKKIEFKYDSSNILNDKIQDTLLSTYNNIPINKIKDTLKGYISQFTSHTTFYNNSPNHGWLIVIICSYLDNSLKSYDVVASMVSLLLKEKENMNISNEKLVNLIKNLKNQMAERKLKISGVEYELLEFKNNKVKGNLLNVITSMIPKSSAIERLEIRDNIYKTFLSHNIDYQIVN